MPQISVRFRNFWPDFIPEDFFIPLVQGIASGIDVVAVTDGPADLEFVSVFDSRASLVTEVTRRLSSRAPRRLSPALAGLHAPVGPDPTARVSVWYSGENIRPPRGDWDLYLSFDADSRLSRNCYLPLWWLQFPELLAPIPAGPAAQKRYADLPTLFDCMSSRTTDTADRPGFACAIIGNPEPVRMRAIDALRQIGPVEVFGRLTGRPVPNKADVLRDYRFALCFENDVYPGYVTEKLIDVWAAGTIPLWSGLEPQGFMNAAAIVNLATFAGLDEFTAAVAGIDADRAAVAEMATQPLLLRRPSLDAVRAEIGRVLSIAGIL